MGLVAAFCVLARVQKSILRRYPCTIVGLPSFSLSFLAASVHVCTGGGTVSNTEQSCVKTPGCTMYRSLYGSVWFGLVAYKMIYHNSDLTVLKCLNLVRCSGRLRIPSKLFNNK